MWRIHIQFADFSLSSAQLTKERKSNDEWKGDCMRNEWDGGRRAIATSCIFINKWKKKNCSVICLESVDLLVVLMKKKVIRVYFIKCEWFFSRWTKNKWAWALAQRTLLWQCVWIVFFYTLNAHGVLTRLAALIYVCKCRDRRNVTSFYRRTAFVFSDSAQSDLKSAIKLIGKLS